MKLLIFSDLQANNYTSYSNYSEGYNSRLLEIIDVLKQIRTYMVSNSIKEFCFLGDFFEPRFKIDVEILYLIGKEFKNWRDLKGSFLVGNHDKYEENDESQTNPLEILMSDNFEVLGDLTIICGKPNIAAIPYRTNRESFLADVKTIEDKVGLKNTVLMMHQGIAEIPLPGDRLAIEKGGKSALILKKELKGFLKVFSGHWHGHRVDGNICMVGSPLQFDFNDVGETRGFVVYDTQTNKMEFVKTKYREFKDYKINTKKELVDLVKKLPEMQEYPRLIIPESLESYLPKSRSFGIKVIPEQKEEKTRIKLSDNWSYSDIIDQYVSYQNKGADFSSFGKKIIKEAEAASL